MHFLRKKQENAKGFSGSYYSALHVEEDTSWGEATVARSLRMREMGNNRDLLARGHRSGGTTFSKLARNVFQWVSEQR